jgi:NAD kinase
MPGKCRGMLRLYASLFLCHPSRIAIADGNDGTRPRTFRSSRGTSPPPLSLSLSRTRLLTDIAYKMSQVTSINWMLRHKARHRRASRCSCVLEFVATCRLASSRNFAPPRNSTTRGHVRLI